MSGIRTKIRVLLLNPSNKWARNTKLYYTLTQQKGFRTKVCNNMGKFRMELDKNPDLIFVPGDKRGVRVCKNIVPDGSHTINMYDCSKDALTAAMGANPAVVGLNTSRL